MKNIVLRMIQNYDEALALAQLIRVAQTVVIDEARGREGECKSTRYRKLSKWINFESPGRFSDEHGSRGHGKVAHGTDYHGVVSHRIDTSLSPGPVR